MTEVNQDSDSPRREPTVELMRQRRDAWRARYDEEHARYLGEHEKVRRLERTAMVAEANRESLETLRQQYRLIHGYWHDVRGQLVKAEVMIRRLTEEGAAQHANYRRLSQELRALRATAAEQETTIARLRELIADQIGEMGQQIERKLPRSLGMGRGPADLSQREEPES